MQLQDTLYNPVLPHNKYEAGEFIDEETGELHLYSKEEAKSLNEKSEKDFLKNRDVPQQKLDKPEYAGNVVFSCGEKDMDARIRGDINALSKICASLRIPFLLFLPIWPFDWLEYKLPDKDLQNAHAWFRSLGMNTGKRFGFRIVIGEVNPFLIHLSQITRKVKNVPEVYFTGPQSPMMASLCRHGNLHFECFEVDFLKQITDAGKKAGLKVVSGECKD